MCGSFRALCLPGSFAAAQTPVGMTVTGIPALPDANAFSTSLRSTIAAANLYAWDGLGVWMKSSTSSFGNIGSVGAGNSADAGPITFSQNGQEYLA